MAVTAKKAICIEKTKMEEVSTENLNASHEYFIVRTPPGKEEAFIDSAIKVLEKKDEHGIYSIFRPESVKGYVFVEAQAMTNVIDNLRGIPTNRGVIRKPIDFSELEKYFEKDGEQIIVNERDIVEITSGPFKGDKAKVVRIVPGKDEIIIEPLNMSVPIPITLSIDDVRVIEPNSKEEEKEEEKE